MSFQCKDWLTVGRCKKGDRMCPLAMDPPENCRILLVSQAPSRSASAMQKLASKENTTFGKMLSLLGVDSDMFRSGVYWTHYAKCYPGAAKDGDQIPTAYCADKYLGKEYQMCLQKGLKLVVAVSRPASLFVYTRFYDKTAHKSSLIFGDMINRVYQSDGVTFVFMKHPSAAASYYMRIETEKFIGHTLHPLVRLALD